MAEYIDRILLGDAVTSHGVVHYEDIMSMPTADVVERKHGKWVLKTFNDGYGEYQLYECNLCGAVTAQRKSKNYCHNCGARMESEE